MLEDQRRDADGCATMDDVDGDDLRDLFAPLRETTTASAPELARVRASTLAPTPRRRRGVVLSGAGLVGTAAVAAAVVLVVDRGRPGTFVGEAGARELLRAAADATRDDPATNGWRRSTTQRVQRLALEGRPCRTCTMERAVLETRSTEDLWSGPRGEAYSVGTAEPPRAVENEPLLRARHALDPPARRPEFRGTHVVPATPGADDRSALLGISQPGAIADPSKVPASQSAIVAFAASRLRAQDRAQREQAAGMGGQVGYSISWSTRVSYALVDLATSPRLAGPQKAAAFEALADRPAVTATPAPAAFASPERVAVRIRARPAPGPAGLSTFQRTDRVIVFDRTSYRVVAEETQERGSGLSAIYSFGEGKNQGRMRAVAGGGGEVRYGDPVDVSGPGLDAEGRRVTSLTGLLDLGRDGQSIRFSKELDRRAQDLARKRARAGRRDGTQ